MFKFYILIEKCIVFLLFFYNPYLVSSFKLKAYLSQNGLHGEITFTHLPSNHIKVTAHLKATIEYPNQIWSWGIHEYSVDYTILEDRCSDANMGRELYSFTDNWGFFSIPENETSEFIISEGLTITGAKGLYGKSLVLTATDSNRRICSVITVEDKSIENIALATFTSPIAGSIYFRWVASIYNHTDSLIETNLYHVSENNTKKRDIQFTEHGWKIFATDIFESDKDRENCNRLQTIFNTNNNREGPSVGDIDTRIGKIKIATYYEKMKMKTLLRDDDLFLLPSDIKGPKRQLYVVIYDENHLESFLGCAKIQHQEPITAKAVIQSHGIQGDIIFQQYSRFDPTFITINLTTAKGDLESKILYGSQVGGYRIHELPKLPPSTANQQSSCVATKDVYNPIHIEDFKVPPPGFGTQDQYSLGDLSGKLLNRNNAKNLIPGTQELRGIYWDIFLPLQGIYSVIHRSVVIYKINESLEATKSEPWICNNIVLYDRYLKYQTPIYTARVIFRYPIVGSILFRQRADDFFADTTVIVEKLVHADGAQLNNSQGHRWAVHELPTGKDYYNWTGRCLSVGKIYNPYQVSFDEKNPSEKCSPSTVGLCRIGDLSLRINTLDIAGKNVDGIKISSRLFTATNLPLTGSHTILQKSLVIYDDYGPKARGERLACSVIYGVYRRKAVVKDWYGNGDPLTVTGKIEFLQQTEYDITNVELDLQGLNENSGYHIHMVSVQSDLEFPCERTTVYNHWNPLSVNLSQSPRSYHGTTDEYEMGDLSGKFGTLDKYKTFSTTFNDTMLPLFGPQAIIGRSVVIHKKEKNKRWACSTIERGYSPSEARELRAIASFHHPAGYAYGYLRMTQLVYNDDSKSETIIEVNLRHPGVNDRNVTRNHNWAIFVNPVGVDAAVKVYATRCVAGGYRWNPYYTQLADPLNEDLYREECAPDNPLRCHVGDLSGRLGTIDIGLKRQVFTDFNTPLEGDETAIGRSIVIYSPERGGERFACANIEPDYDIIKYSNIEKPPRFVLAQFIEDIRRVMGVPEWMITVDARKTKTLHNGYCIQFLLHFKGPIANALEIDYTRLIINGRLDSPTLYIPGYFNTKRKPTISYRQCGVTDPNEKRSRKGRLPISNASQRMFSKNIFLVIVLVFFFQYEQLKN